MNDIKINYFLYRTAKNRVVSLTERKIVASRPFRGRFKSEPWIITGFREGTNYWYKKISENNPEELNIFASSDFGHSLLTYANNPIGL